MRLYNRTRNTILSSNVESAKSLLKRLKGLLGRSTMPKGDALWIEPCNSIHTFFMRFSIDAIFVDRKFKVRRVVRHLPSGRLVLPIWGAHSVFEFLSTPGEDLNVSEGDELYVGD
jgi:uncharacterized protein